MRAKSSSISLDQRVFMLLGHMYSGVESFNREVIDLPIPRKPEALSRARTRWAQSALLEEVDEFVKASNKGDVTEAADGLIDLIYFALGRLVEMGVPVKAAFDEVQRANMNKTRGTLSKRPDSKGFDAVKPPGWQAPSHEWLLDFDMDFVEELQRRAALWDETSPFLKGAIETRVTKGADYNAGGRLDDYFPLGHLSYFQLMYMKLLRLKSLLVLAADGRQPNHEGMLDTVLDLTNYSTYYGERLLRQDLPDLRDVAGMLKESAK